MKALVLKNIKNIEIKSVPVEKPAEDEIVLKVEYCSICRTDAKMWSQGQRDLKLPRILGHEIAGVDQETGKRFVVWPGRSCGACAQCLSEHENLCANIKIIGFDSDGGFAEFVKAPRQSLVPIPDNIPSRLACLAEPLACGANALDQIIPRPNGNILIYGAGPVGIMTAIASASAGLNVSITDNQPEKIEKCARLCVMSNIAIVEEPRDSTYDAIINATPSSDAFADGLRKLKPAGTFVFFGGLAGGNDIPLKVLNEIHYRQLTLTGAYGCAKRHMEQALKIMSSRIDLFEFLIEKTITLDEVASALPDVLAGKHYKYIAKMSWR